MTYYKLVSKNPEEGGPPSVFVPVIIDWDSMIEDILPDLVDCVIHGSYGTGCDFDTTEAKKVILDAIKKETQ